MHSTRERILHHLKRRPGASVEALTQSLELAPMTIRQHLARLAGDGLVEVQSERRPIGRPAHVYHLTPASEERFPKAYERLSHLMLEEMTLDDGTSDWSSRPGRREAFRKVAQRAAAPHRAQLAPLEAPERLEAAVEILRAESGFTELERTSAGVEVREYNCVFQRVAEGHEEICAFHTEYISQLVGVAVELEACQCDGAHACRFRVTAQEIETE